MSTSRTQWHVLFYAALREHGPRSVEVLAEVLLSAEPQLADVVLLRHTELAPGYYLVETKPYRLLVVDLSEVVEAEKDEWMAVLVPSTMLSARARRWLEEHMPMKEVSPDDKLEGHEEVLERLLQSLTPEEILKAAGTTRLLASLPPEEILKATGTTRLLESLPPEEILKATGTTRLLESLPPEQRLAGLAPEQRLAGLAPEEAPLALPDSALRALSDDYVRTLPDEVQATIRRRLRKSSPGQ